MANDITLQRKVVPFKPRRSATRPAPNVQEVIDPTDYHRHVLRLMTPGQYPGTVDGSLRARKGEVIYALLSLDRGEKVCVMGQQNMRVDGHPYAGLRRFAAGDRVTLALTFDRRGSPQPVLRRTTRPGA